MKAVTLRAVTSLVIALLMCCAGGASAAVAVENPNEVTSGDLVNEPKRHEGPVTFQGEAIGEAMVRGEGAWIHLNDDAYMYENVEEGAPLGGYNSGMPVWLDAGLAERIETYGDYKHQGDIVTVRGVFNPACREHGGDMDIHAAELEVIVKGRRAEDPVKPWKVPAVLLLTAAASVVFVAERRLGHRETRGILRHR